MKIAVSTNGDGLDAFVDERFGRAAKFILMDTETGAFKVVDNVQSRSAAQGAGIQAAETVARSGAEVVITRHCGPKAFRTLEAAGVKIVIGAGGTVREALQAFESGWLKPSGNPDVVGHW